MSEKHTPGPWTAAKGGIYGGDAAVCKRHPEDSNDRWAANARLIAAAPELLKACRAMLDHYAILGDKVCDNARAAIARATE